MEDPRTDGRVCLYSKLTYEPKVSGELIIIMQHLDNFVCLVHLEVVITKKPNHCTKRGFSHVKVSNQYAFLQTRK